MCTLQRRPAFVDERLVSIARLQFLQCAQASQFAILAYTFMPDHLHALVEGVAPSSDFRDFCLRLRRRTSAACWQTLRDRLWQNGYHERALRDSANVDAVVAYIIGNPVRAGLVERAEDYPYSWRVILR